MANLLDFATQGNPVRGDMQTDTTPAFNAALTALQSSTTDRTLILPAGNLLFLTQPNDITFSLKMSGQGHNVTGLIRGYSTSNAPMLKVIGGGEMYGGAAVNFEDFHVDAGGFDGGVGIWIQAPTEIPGLLKGPHGTILKNVYAVAGAKYPAAGSWLDGFFLDGSLNGSPPSGVAWGMRNVCLDNCAASQYTAHPVYGYWTAGCRFVGKFDGWVNLNSSNPHIYMYQDQGSVNMTNWPCDFV